MKSIPNLHQHYSLLLGLIPPWTVVNVDLNLPEKRVEIEVKWPIEYMVSCPECGKNCSLKDRGENLKSFGIILDLTQTRFISKSFALRTSAG